MRSVTLLCLLLALSAQPALAASLTDSMLGRLVGTWTVTGTTQGSQTNFTNTGAEVRTQFYNSFIEIHISDPSGRSPYEVRLFIGEAKDGTIIAHWLDGGGAERSRILGTGRIIDDRIELRFPYPDGEFRRKIEYDRLRDRWRLLIETGSEKEPKTFSDWYFERVKMR